MGDAEYFARMFSTLSLNDPQEDYTLEVTLSKIVDTGTADSEGRWIPNTAIEMHSHYIHVTKIPACTGLWAEAPAELGKIAYEKRADQSEELIPDELCSPSGKTQVACSLISALDYLSGLNRKVTITEDDTGLFEDMCLDGCSASSAIDRIRGVLFTRHYFSENPQQTWTD